MSAVIEDGRLCWLDQMIAMLISGWGIKDSYSELELQEKGFTVAFEAHWYCRLPDQHLTEVKSSGLKLETVQTPSELNRWVAALGERIGVFNSSLLENNTIELIYVERVSKVVSGFATNRSGDSIGISNVFGSHDDNFCCVASVAGRYPMKEIVGYSSKAEVVALSEIGFKELGNLRVWLRD